MINASTDSASVRILLIEDNLGDALLTRESLKESRVSVQMDHVENGDEALQYLKQQGNYSSIELPDLILLDLNLPGKNGHEILQDLKQDKQLKHIPVVMLTSSEDEQDIFSSYNLGASCYVPKPVRLEEFSTIMKSLEMFWFTIVKLPVKN